MPLNQGLMKRSPNLTPEQFSESWCKDHNVLIIPHFLHSGVTCYAQIHAPLSTTSPEIDITQCIFSPTSSFGNSTQLTNPDSGAAEMSTSDVLKIWAPNTSVPMWK